MKETKIEVKSFGGCSKHPNFPMMKCPMCEVDKELTILDLRIDAGEEIILKSKKQMRNLRHFKKELDRLKIQIEAEPESWGVNVKNKP